MNIRLPDDITFTISVAPQDKIYLVYGCTGEWEDYQSWNVKAFPTKEDAIKFCNKCQEFVDKNVNPTATENYSNLTQKGNPHDSSMTVDYTGVTYQISEVPYENSFDK